MSWPVVAALLLCGALAGFSAADEAGAVCGTYLAVLACAATDDDAAAARLSSFLGGATLGGALGGAAWAVAAGALALLLASAALRVDGPLPARRRGGHHRAP